MSYDEGQLIRLSDEHVLINNYIVKFENLIAVDDITGIAQLLKTMYPFMEKDLERHFTFEENYFFPAALYSGNERNTISLVLNLQKQHGQILAELSHVLRLIKDTAWITLGRGMEFKKQLINFMDLLKKHIKLEITVFFPFLANDEKAQDFLRTGGIS